MSSPVECLLTHPYFVERVDRVQTFPSYIFYYFKKDSFSGSIWIPRNWQEYRVHISFHYVGEEQKGISRDHEIEKCPIWFASLFQQCQMLFPTPYRPTAVAHVYAQPSYHEDAHLVLNRFAAEKLIESLSEALTRGSSQMDVFPTDGEGYSIVLQVTDDSLHTPFWDSLQAPYAQTYNDNTDEFSASDYERFGVRNSDDVAVAKEKREEEREINRTANARFMQIFSQGYTKNISNSEEEEKGQ